MLKTKLLLKALFDRITVSLSLYYTNISHKSMGLLRNN